jgi:hypothetical protein
MHWLLKLLDLNSMVLTEGREKLLTYQLHA